MKKYILIFAMLLIGSLSFSQSVWIHDGESNASIRQKFNALKITIDSMLHQLSIHGDDEDTIWTKTAGVVHLTNESGSVRVGPSGHSVAKFIDTVGKQIHVEHTRSSEMIRQTINGDFKSTGSVISGTGLFTDGQNSSSFLAVYGDMVAAIGVSPGEGDYNSLAVWDQTANLTLNGKTVLDFYPDGIYPGPGMNLGSTYYPFQSGVIKDSIKTDRMKTSAVFTGYRFWEWNGIGDTILPTDYIVRLNADLNGRPRMYLPFAAENKGRNLIITVPLLPNDYGLDLCTYDGSGETILNTVSDRNGCLEEITGKTVFLTCDGSNWILIAVMPFVWTY